LFKNATQTLSSSVAIQFRPGLTLTPSRLFYLDRVLKGRRTEPSPSPASRPTSQKRYKGRDEGGDIGLAACSERRPQRRLRSLTASLHPAGWGGADRAGKISRLHPQLRASVLITSTACWFSAPKQSMTTGTSVVPASAGNVPNEAIQLHGPRMRRAAAARRFDSAVAETVVDDAKKKAHGC
jgi:hypothetical protein